MLDFQSLYPSVIIAYNLCYSTLLGALRVGKGAGLAKHNDDAEDDDDTQGSMASAPHAHDFAIDPTPHGDAETFEVLGCTTMPEAFTAKYLHDTDMRRIAGSSSSSSSDSGHFISPSGSIFCHPSVCRGVLPDMLIQCLDTRLMVKRAMKLYQRDFPHEELLVKLLDAQQTAIKLLCNTTYGYTSASFSGRMPCSALADAIVSSARATLEFAIEVFNYGVAGGGTKLAGEGHPIPDWSCGWHDGDDPKKKPRVIYGDTDSMMLFLPGLSREKAFRMGKEIEQVITGLFPKPIEIKFEKVYHGSLFQAKKVGSKKKSYIANSIYLLNLDDSQ